MRDFIYQTIIKFSVDNPKASDFDLPTVSADNATAQTILSIVFGVIGALAVLIIVLAGLRFITGGDDPEKIARAKRTIIFAFVGLAIAISAQVIVNVVLGGVF